MELVTAKDIFAFSDLHGDGPLLEAALALIDLLGHPHRLLLVVGDLVDEGPDSAAVLYRLRALSEEYPRQVVILLGNHEEDWLAWLDAEDSDFAWLSADEAFVTTRAFLGAEKVARIAAAAASSPDDLDVFERINGAVKHAVKTEHADLIEWVRGLPLFHETDEQIFVHAGVEEDAGEDWRLVTSDHRLLNKYPPTFGPFIKTIVAGHVSTEPMHGDGSHGIFHDGASHYFLDGDVPKTGVLNVLVYDTTTKTYEYMAVSSPVKR